MSVKQTISFIVVLTIMFSAIGSVAFAQDDVTLTLLNHWGNERWLADQQAIIDEFNASHPGVTVEVQTVPFAELLTKIRTGRTTGITPDMYHIYNLWLADLANAGAIIAPPEDVVEAVLADAAPAAVEGITIFDQVWGYPTEINTYQLIYNKRLLEEAGYSEPPETWEEFKEIAAAITKTDDTGAISQVGFALFPGWDSGMVHPFSALMFSNGGEYLTEDFSATAFNSPEGVETLELLQEMIETGGLDMSINGFDFSLGKVGMIILANWWRADLMSFEDVDYETEVGVAPIPVGPSGESASTIGYHYLLTVDADSPNKEAAWEFIRWMNTPRGEGEGSPMGDYLVNTLGAMPSFGYDQEAFADDLSDHFLMPYVESTAVVHQEPIVLGAQEIKTLLQTQIEAVLAGQMDAASALEQTAYEADAILEEMRLMAE